MTNGSRYLSSSLSLSVPVPDDWSIEERESTLLIFNGPPGDMSAYSNATLSITLSTVEQKSEIWLEKLIQESEARQRQGYDNYQILHQERFWLDDQWAYLRRVKWSPDGLPEPQYHIQSILWPGHESLFIMKGASSESLAIQIMEKSIRSIQLDPSSRPG